jgi:hypothetical protein
MNNAIILYGSSNGEDNCFKHSFETWPGGSNRDLADPGLQPDRIEEKIRKRKTWCDSVKNLVVIC